MNHFRQRVAAGMDYRAGWDEFDFETTEELINSDTVQRYLNSRKDLELWMSDELLMVRKKDKSWHWCVGYITHPDQVDLPKWEEDE